MKKNKIITFVSIFILCLSLFATLIFEDGIASRIAEVVTLVTAVIGAVALYLQFKRDKEINEANFVLEFWKSFSENEKLIEIQQKCDNDMHSKQTSLKDSDYSGILMYAQWLEALCAIINRDILSFDVIDNMYNYMFFVFVNNKYIQEKELLPSIEYYQGIVKAYQEWTKYLNKHNKKIILQENALDQAIERYNKNKKR